MPTYTKVLQAFTRNTIQQRIYAVAGKTGHDPEDIKNEIIEALDIKPNKLSYYLKNANQPDIKEFFLIAQVLECTMNDLIEPEIK